MTHYLTLFLHIPLSKSYSISQYFISLGSVFLKLFEALDLVIWLASEYLPVQVSITLSDLFKPWPASDWVSDVFVREPEMLHHNLCAKDMSKLRN